MKKAFALVIVVLLLAAMTVPAVLAADGATVTVTVSVDGELKLTAEPITVTDLTVEAVLKAAHEASCPEGAAGFVAGTDPTWNMYMISKFWNVAGTPYVVLNGAPLGAGENMMAFTADTAAVKDGDNLNVSISSDMTKPALAVSLTAAVADGNCTVTAQNWVMDFTTFAYNPQPLAGYEVVDATGASLGTTGADGTLTFPATAKAVIPGIAAVPADGSAAAGAAAAPGAAPAAAPATGEAITVYVSISADGYTKIASQPVSVTTYTVEAALQEAHRQYCPEGEAAFAAGTNNSYAMYMISKVWGVEVTPYVILNNAPLGSGENTAYVSADTCPVKAGDNIIVVADAKNVTPAVSMKVDDMGIVSLQQWALDFTTFKYTSAAVENADIIDAETGEVLGTTNALGNARPSKTPACGVVGYQGIGAIRVTDDVKSFTPYGGQYVAPARDYSIFGGEDGQSLLRIVIFGLAIAIPLLIIVLYAHTKEIKTGGVKYADMQAGLDVTKHM